MNTFCHRFDNSRLFFGVVLIALFACMVSSFAQEERPALEGSVKGVIIVAAKEGAVKFSVDGKVLPAEATKTNAALSEGVLIETEADGKVTLLFSNGTVSTVGFSTKILLKEFRQEKFDGADRSMGELKGEPSLSNVKLSLDFGSLVVGTKKLKKESTFDIESSVGTAGIRGTEFQVAQPAGGGFSLDVAESTVAFIPKGAAEALPISTGNGLDVTAGAAPVSRPINPAVAQAITQTNAGAFALTADISLNEVSAKMVEVASGQEADDADGSNEEANAAPGSPVDHSLVLDNNPRLRDGRKQGQLDDRTKLVLALRLSQELSKRFYSYPREIQDALVQETPPVAQRILGIYPPVSEAFRYYGYGKPTRERTLGSLSDELIAVSLGTAFSESQFVDLLGYEDAVRAKVLDEPPVTARRLMDVHALDGDITVFYAYDADLRGRILQLEQDQAVSALLRKKYDGETIAVLLSDDNLPRLGSASDAVVSALRNAPDADTLARYAVFVADSQSNGNGFILEGLLEMGEGELTPELLDTGEEANRLLTDLAISGGITSAHATSAFSVTSNPFYAEPAAVWKQLSASHFSEALPVAIAGRKLSLGSGDYSYGALLNNDADTLLVTASSSLNVTGSIAFSGPAGRSTRVVLSSGGSVTATVGTTLEVALADLAIASQNDLALRQVALAAGSKVYLSSLRDMLIENVDVRATDEVRLDALRTLSVDNLRFSEELRAIHMRATTLDLSNLNFPGQAAVRLESLKGGVDGKYPTFGTPNRAYGRVNFLENVRSGGNPLFDRTSFDLHGQNVSIGKIPGR
jgi:hypothetical protein